MDRFDLNLQLEANPSPIVPRFNCFVDFFAPAQNRPTGVPDGEVSEEVPWTFENVEEHLMLTTPNQSWRSRVFQRLQDIFKTEKHNLASRQMIGNLKGDFPAVVAFAFLFTLGKKTETHLLCRANTGTIPQELHNATSVSP